jgi:ADP-heptose:LPS heptosyltransferase
LSNNRVLGLAAGLQTIAQDYTDILNIPKENLDDVQKWFEYNHCDASNTIAISIGASKKRQNKCLEESKWIEVINILSQKGFNCVLLGAKWEMEVLNKMAGKCKITPKLFIAKNGILSVAAFLKKCSLFVGIDSGPMHLAAAVGTKCIGIFGHTDPMQIGPMPLKRHVIIKKDDISQVAAEDIVAKII